VSSPHLFKKSSNPSPISTYADKEMLPISYVPLGKIELEDQKSSPAIQPGFSF
jgi:hypothetical protein